MDGRTDGRMDGQVHAGGVAWLIVGGIFYTVGGTIFTVALAATLFWLLVVHTLRSSHGGWCVCISLFLFQTEKPNPVPGKFGFHEIWHIFVILGAASHWCVQFRRPC